MIRGNRRLTVREIGDEVSISLGCCHPTLTEKLPLRLGQTEMWHLVNVWKASATCILRQRESRENKVDQSNFIYLLALIHTQQQKTIKVKY